MRLRSRVVTSTIATAITIVSLILGGCGSGGNVPASPLAAVQAQLDKAEQRIEALETENGELRLENRRLAEKLAATTGPGGLNYEHEQKLLDNRKAGLNHLEQQLIERETGIRQRELAIERQQNEFYEKTNMTMEEIGEARQVKKEFENMRAEKDAANAESKGWLKFVWGLTIAVAVLVMAFLVMIFRSISEHMQARRDLELRKGTATLLAHTLSNRLDPDQAVPVIKAFNQIAGIEQSLDHHQTVATDE